MTRLLHVAPMFLCFSGCLDFKFDPLPESVVVTTHVLHGGHGTIRMDWRNITSSKEGVECEKRVKDFISEFKKADWAGPGGFAGCENITSDIGYDSDGTLNSHVEGQFPDIFVLLRFIDSSWPYRLRSDATFSCIWDGNILSIKNAIQRNHERSGSETECATVGCPIKIRLVITTEGEVVTSNFGQISKDRRQLVIEDLRCIGKEWSFSIRGLATQ